MTDNSAGPRTWASGSGSSRTWFGAFSARPHDEKEDSGEEVQDGKKHSETRAHFGARERNNFALEEEVRLARRPTGFREVSSVVWRRPLAASVCLSPIYMFVCSSVRPSVCPWRRRCGKCEASSRFGFAS